MKKLILIPIVLLLLSACLPCPTIQETPVVADCTWAFRIGYEAGYKAASDNISQTICCCDICILFPTTQEVLDFVALDDTDKLPSDPNNFVCADYTHRISENAWAQDIPCYSVMIVLEYVDGYAMFHECVAFPVRDSPNLLFIEPQNDLVIHDVMAGSIPYVCADNNGNGFCKFLVEKPVLKILVNR